MCGCSKNLKMFSSLSVIKSLHISCLLSNLSSNVNQMHTCFSSVKLLVKS